MTRKTNASKLPLAKKGDDSIKAARSWWSGIVSDPRFAVILNEAKANATAFTGLQDTPHGQFHAGGHNAGIKSLAEAIENLAYPDSD